MTNRQIAEQILDVVSAHDEMCPTDIIDGLMVLKCNCLSIIEDCIQDAERRGFERGFNKCKDMVLNLTIEAQSLKPEDKIFVDLWEVDNRMRLKIQSLQLSTDE